VAIRVKLFGMAIPEPSPAVARKALWEENLDVFVKTCFIASADYAI
jgi:hypothetical protein